MGDTSNGVSFGTVIRYRSYGGTFSRTASTLWLDSSTELIRRSSGTRLHLGRRILACGTVVLYIPIGLFDLDTTNAVW